MWRGLAAGALAGLGWGVVARGFMRLLSDDPQFSWAGTLGILGVAVVSGACLGLVHAARVAGRSQWWRLAALPALVLFAGPGGVLAPAAVGMAVVLRARAVIRPLGVLLVVATPLLAMTAPPSAPTRTQLAGLAVLVLSAAPLGWGLVQALGRWEREPSGAGSPSPTPAADIAPAPVAA